MSPQSSSGNVSPIEEIIVEMRLGRMVVLVDEEDRENEGDLILAAEHVTPEAINFMARFGRGLICLTLTAARCRQLGLTQMARDNKSPYSTAFTVSIEAAEGVTTGISAQDRALTIKTAVARNARPEHIVQPGHVFPIMAQAFGGVAEQGQQFFHGVFRQGMDDPVTSPASSGEQEAPVDGVPGVLRLGRGRCPSSFNSSVAGFRKRWFRTPHGLSSTRTFGRCRCTMERCRVSAGTMCGWPSRIPSLISWRRLPLALKQGRAWSSKTALPAPGPVLRRGCTSCTGRKRFLRQSPTDRRLASVRRRNSKPCCSDCSDGVRSPLARWLEDAAGTLFGQAFLHVLHRLQVRRTALHRHAGAQDVDHHQRR